MIVLKYPQIHIVSQNETDIKIDELNDEGPLINSFFLVNSLPEEMKFKEIIEYMGRSFVPDKLLPQLDFDPEFKRILDDDAIKELYDTSFITNWLDSKPPPARKYQISNPRAKIIAKIKERPHERFFEMNNELWISKYNYKTFIYLGWFFFTSNKQIEEIVKQFGNYYSKQLIEKRSEISKVLQGFLSLFKLVDSKTFIKIRLNKLKTLLNKVLDHDEVNVFLDRFIFYYSSGDFNLGNDSDSVEQFFSDYHDFLCAAAYSYSGIVYTGVFVIWRAMIKYFENLQKINEFINRKGALFEEWCYRKAVEQGFNVKKIILRNARLPPSDKYDKMLKQIESFPIEPYIFECEFYGDYENSTFFEIDLAIRVEKYLYLIECKSSGTLLSEMARYVKWMNNFHKNMQLLIVKGKHLIKNIKENNLDHDFLNGVEKFIPIIVKTEGLITPYGTLQAEHFEKFLKKLGKNVENNTLEKFLKTPLSLEDN